MKLWHPDSAGITSSAVWVSQIEVKGVGTQKSWTAEKQDEGRYFWLDNHRAEILKISKVNKVGFRWEMSSPKGCCGYTGFSQVVVCNEEPKELSRLEYLIILGIKKI